MEDKDRITRRLILSDEKTFQENCMEAHGELSRLYRQVKKLTNKVTLEQENSKIFQRLIFCLTEIVCSMNATADFHQGTDNVIRNFFNLLTNKPVSQTQVLEPPKQILPIPLPLV